MPSKLRLILKQPFEETDPSVGRMAYSPALLAGYTREPPVSVPIEKGTKPAETLTPEPAEDPPAV